MAALVDCAAIFLTHIAMSSVQLAGGGRSWSWQHQQCACVSSCVPTRQCVTCDALVFLKNSILLSLESSRNGSVSLITSSLNQKWHWHAAIFLSSFIKNNCLEIVHYKQAPDKPTNIQSPPQTPPPPGLAHKSPGIFQTGVGNPFTPQLNLLQWT